MTAAFYLALLGHEVVVFDSHAEPGGMLRFALPAYRLPREVLDREIEIIRRLGVNFVLNSSIGSDISLSDLEAKFDAVFLSLGTWQETDVRVPGNELTGVFGALHFLEAEARGEAVKLGQRVVIIGGGNAAIDCARTVIRMGASATVIYRRERKDMPAISEEVEAAEDEGVRIIFLASPHRIVGEARRGQGDRGDQDAARRVRHIRPTTTPSTPAKCSTSAATASSWRSAKASTATSAAGPASRSPATACSRSTATR